MKRTHLQIAVATSCALIICSYSHAAITGSSVEGTLWSSVNPIWPNGVPNVLSGGDNDSQGATLNPLTATFNGYIFAIESSGRSCHRPFDYF